MSSDEEAEFDDKADESSDDMPLSRFKKRANGDEDSEEGELHEDDDLPSPTRKKRKSADKAVNYNENSDDEEEEEEEEDDDDDVPLMALASKKPTKSGAKAPEKKKPANSSKPKLAKKKVVATKKKEVVVAKATSEAYQSASAALYGSECQKGQLIQKLLCRWWYAISWPGPEAMLEKPPAHYDSLDGFPGVYICTEGEDVGKIMDVRNKANCPNFVNFAKKSSEELQGLLLKALDEQKRQLERAEGKGTPTEKEIIDTIKWAQKIKPSTADKEAEKVLKAAKMTLA